MPLTLQGFKVVVSSACQTRPRLKISDSFPWITEDVRARINGELLGMFGADDDSYVVGDTLYTTRRVFVNLQNHQDRQCVTADGQLVLMVLKGGGPC